MRKVLALAFVAAAVVGYMLTPFLSAYQIRNAIRSGDTSLLETLVEWRAVRESLKSSLAELDRQKTEMSSRHGMPTPSLWSRIKSAATSGMADRMIDQYVSASGVTQMYAARSKWKSVTATDTPAGVQAISGDALDPADAADQSALERFVRFWQRVKRAEFRSLGEIELEVADRKVPERRYVGTMEFRGLGWKLTRLEILGVGF